MRRCVFFATITLLLGTATPVEAGLVLSISSTTVAQGGSGAIDLTIQTDGTPTPLGEFAFDVYINGSGTHNAPALTFVDPSDTGYRSLSTYVFAGASGGGAVAYSSLSGSAGPNQEVGGGDIIDFLSVSDDVTVGITDTFLLARLSLAASSSAVIGDTYTIQVFSDPDPVVSATGYTERFLEHAGPLTSSSRPTVLPL